MASLADRTGARTRFLMTAAGSLALVLITWAALVATEPGQRIENLGLLGVEFRTSAEREAALERLSVISTTMFGLTIVGVFLVALARRRAALGGAVVASMVVAVVLAQVLKEVLPRPELLAGPVWLLRNSFPSGTAAVAVAVAVGGLLVVPDRLRWVVLPVGAVYAAAIGEATQATGWHRLSDVVGSTLLVVMVASVMLAGLASAGLVQPAPAGRVDRRIRNTLGVIALIALLLGAALIGVAAIFPVLLSPTGSRRAFLQTALPLVGVGLTVSILLAFGRVVEPWSLGEGRSPGPSTGTRRASPHIPGGGVRP